MVNRILLEVQSCFAYPNENIEFIVFFFDRKDPQKRQASGRDTIEGLAVKGKK